MVGGHVYRIIFVHIRFHRHSLLIKNLVILGARKRRENKELQQIDGQFSLNDFDVSQDGLGRILGEAKYITSESDGTD